MGIGAVPDVGSLAAPAPAAPVSVAVGSVVVAGAAVLLIYKISNLVVFGL
jgi:hypothetical protein